MAVLLPNGRQQFSDANGKPLAGGRVWMYQPGTTTPAITWQDPGQTVPNGNPIDLDSSGEALIYGIGNYRQVVEDVFRNTIWDQLTGIGMPGAPGGFIYASTYGLRQGGSDAAAIQAAINAAANLPNGATVYLGPGPITFQAGQQIIWPSYANGVILRGDGPQTTVITINGNLASDVMNLTAGNLAHCQIRDLGFNCLGTGTGGALIHFGNCYSAVVENVRMAGGFNNGILITGGSNQYITQIRDLIAPANGTANACVLVGDDSGVVQATYIDNCKFANSVFGVYIRNAGGVSITDSEFLSHSQSGIITSPGTNDFAKGIDISGCFIDSCLGPAINIGHAGGFTFVVSIDDCQCNVSLVGVLVGPNPNVNAVKIYGCQFIANQQNALYNVGASALSFNNNLCAGNGVQAANTYDAILQANGVNCTIEDNIISATQGFPAMHRYAINLTGASDYTIVMGNTTGGPAGTGSISNTATGSHNLVTNNVGT